MIKIIIIMMILIQVCVGTISVSESYYNNIESLSLSTSLNSGEWQESTVLDQNEIISKDLGYSDGDCSVSMIFINPFIIVKDDFESKNRDTKWMIDIDNNIEFTIKSDGK
jgi:hypothetical protein